MKYKFVELTPTCNQVICACAASESYPPRSLQRADLPEVTTLQAGMLSRSASYYSQSNLLESCAVSDVLNHDFEELKCFVARSYRSLLQINCLIFYPFSFQQTNASGLESNCSQLCIILTQAFSLSLSKVRLPMHLKSFTSQSSSPQRVSVPYQSAPTLSQNHAAPTAIYTYSPSTSTSRQSCCEL